MLNVVRVGILASESERKHNRHGYGADDVIGKGEIKPICMARQYPDSL